MSLTVRMNDDLGIIKTNLVIKKRTMWCFLSFAEVSSCLVIFKFAGLSQFHALVPDSSSVMYHITSLEQRQNNPPSD